MFIDYLDDVFTLKDLLSYWKNKAKSLLQLKILSSSFYFKFLIIDDHGNRQ